jgi:hypothetical protein
MRSYIISSAMLRHRERNPGKHVPVDLTRAATRYYLSTSCHNEIMDAVRGSSRRSDGLEELHATSLLRCRNDIAITAMLRRHYSRRKRFFIYREGEKNEKKPSKPKPHSEAHAIPCTHNLINLSTSIYPFAFHRSLYAFTPTATCL